MCGINSKYEINAYKLASAPRSKRKVKSVGDMGQFDGYKYYSTLYSL